MSKLISGRAYYYLVESARVDGKPRIVSQRYLGPADEVLARLRVAEIVDEVAGPRRKDAAALVGTYVALCVANRIVALNRPGFIGDSIP